jgi:hypothetical protein
MKTARLVITFFMDRAEGNGAGAFRLPGVEGVAGFGFVEKVQAA